MRLHRVLFKGAIPARAWMPAPNFVLARHLSTELRRMPSFIDLSSKKGSHGAQTAEGAVNNILYSASTSSRAKNRHMLSVLVDNQSGVLSKVSGMLSSRGFNIDSLTVSKTNVAELSRMTIVLHGADAQVEQARRQLEDLVDVFAVTDYSQLETIKRELLMIKVGTVPVELQGMHTEPTGGPIDMSDLYRRTMESHNHREAVLQIAQVFHASVCDRGNEDITFQLVSVPREIEGFMNMLSPFGIIEAVRSGVIAMSRTEVPKPGGDDDERVKKVVDLASLPPS